MEDKNFKQVLAEKGFSEEDVVKMEALRSVMVQGIDTDIQAKINDLASRGVTDKEEILNQIKDLQDKVDDSRSAQVGKKNDMDAFEQSLRGMFDNIKTGSSPSKGEFKDASVRAATVMTLSDAITQAPDFVKTTIDKTIHAAPEPRLGVVARLNKGATRTASTKYTSLAGSEGNAAVTAEGALKPLYSTSYTNAEATIKKIPVRIKVSEEFEDFTELYNDVVTRAKRSISTVLEQEVVNGAGGADHLTGITSVAPAFNVPALAESVQNPNTSDAIYAQAVQIGMLGYDANVCFINYLDYAKLQFIKDTTDRPMTAEVMAKLSQMTFVLVGSEVITAGNTLVMDDRFWQLFVNEIKTREGYGVQKIDTEYYSDLDVNQRTIIFELFVKSYCPAVELGSVCYDEIETIKTAIAQPLN